MCLVLVLQSRAFAMVYRPYLNCATLDQQLIVDVKQNVDQLQLTHAFAVSITRQDQKAQFENLAAVEYKHKRKTIMEWLKGKTDGYSFDLVLSKTLTPDGYKSLFSDQYGRKTLYCNYQITFDDL